MLKLRLNNKGFTLTEVMIAIMILTVAIVSASSLLVGLVRSNQNNLTTLQAYYLAQEGLEAVRNIRDTNWLHNLDWLGADSTQLWGGDLSKGQSISIGLQNNFNGCGAQAGDLLPQISACKPWLIANVVNPDEGLEGLLYKNGSEGEQNIYLSSLSEGGEETSFRRVITFKEYCPKQGICELTDDADFVLVESKVTWNLGSQERELILYEVLTNWKNGAL